MTSLVDRETSEQDAPLLLTVPDTPHGPIISRLLRRTWLGLGLLWVVGLVLVASPVGAAWHAAGLSLFIPGAGFLYGGGWVLGAVFFALTLVMFGLSLVAWFGSGMIIAPPIVVTLAAVLAALRADHPHQAVRVVVPTIAVALTLAGVAGNRRAFRAAQRRGHERNRYLANLYVRAADDLADSSFVELDEQALAHQRWLLDLALQPVDQFAGFDFVDQFQTAAVRYQINFSQFCLALNQYCSAPNFHGALSAAQRNLIAKMQLKPVWSYWRWENLWGNFDLNPDPIPRDNIMLSGYLGVMLASYESNTGDDRYSLPGAVTFRWNDKKSFSYSFPEIVGAVHHNFTRYDVGLFPCEPNWIYTGCNTFGMNTLMIADRLHGTDHFAQVVDAFARGLNEEFGTPDGRVTAIRSSRLGLTIPSLTSTMADVGSALFLHGILPDMAQRLWAISRHELVDVRDVESGADGGVDVELRGWDRIDVGNYKPSNVTARASLLATAREMGDDDLAQRLARSLHDPDAEPGGRPLPSASVMTNAMMTLGILGRRDGWRQMMNTPLPASIHAGPVLDEVPHPDVQVARAVSDGTGLQLVLRPGNGGTRARLGLARLAPGQAYDLRGAVDHRVVADSSGRACFDVDVDGRTEVRVSAA